MMFLFLLQAQQTTPSFTWPPGWAVIGWIVAAIVAIIYLYSGVLQNLSSGRKDLIEVGEKKLASVTKEKEESIHGTGFMILMGLVLLITVADIFKFRG